MNDVPTFARHRLFTRIRLLITGVCALALAVAALVLSAPAQAASTVCSSQTGTSNGSY